MSITKIDGHKFFQIKFTETSGEVYEMPQEQVIRGIRVTAKPGKLTDSDYITFYEATNNQPDICILSDNAKAVKFDQKLTKLGISDYSLTYPADVVVSIEVD